MQDKAILSGNGWIQRSIAQDIDNVGRKAAKIVIKNDQERLWLHFRMRHKWHRTVKTILANSPAGETEGNGGVEDAIRRVQEKVRTPKCQVEAEAEMDVDRCDDLMPWMARWAGELITKYSLGKDGKTAYERMCGRSCGRPIAKFRRDYLVSTFWCPKPVRKDGAR